MASLAGGFPEKADIGVMQGYIGFRDEGLGFRGGTSLGDVAFWCLHSGPPLRNYQLIPKA